MRTLDTDDLQLKINICCSCWTETGGDEETLSLFKVIVMKPVVFNPELEEKSNRLLLRTNKQTLN